MSRRIPSALRSAELTRHRLVPEASAGLFVGVRELRDKTLTEVKYAADDAVDLAHLFTVELGLLTPKKVVIALAGRPEKESSRKALDDLIALGATSVAADLHALYHWVYVASTWTQEPGIYVASFAGHGFNDQGTNLFCPFDTLFRRKVHTSIDLEAICDDIDQAEAQRRLVFIDACRTRLTESRTGLEDGPPATEEFLNAFAQVRGMAALYAASRGGHSYDDHQRSNGVFTGAVLDGLRGAAKQHGQPFITLRHLATYVDHRTRDWVARNRTQHLATSRGAHASFDSIAMENLPLALNPEPDAPSAATGDLQGQRRERALRKLQQDLQAPLTPQVLDLVRTWLEGESTPFQDQLLQQIEALDGTLLRRQALMFVILDHQQTSANAAASTESPRGLSRGLPPR
jgi:hypothetical protein